jgi:hypothetical protein
MSGAAWAPDGIAAEEYHRHEPEPEHTPLPA